MPIRTTCYAQPKQDLSRPRPGRPAKPSASEPADDPAGALLPRCSSHVPSRRVRAATGQIRGRHDRVAGSHVRRRSRSVFGSVSPRGVMLAAPQPRLVSITRNLDLHHDEPVVSGDDNALFASGQLMSNRDSEQVASVVIDTILFFPTHQDVAHAVRRATFTASRSQLEVVRHGTSVRPSFPARDEERNHSHDGEVCSPAQKEIAIMSVVSLRRLFACPPRSRRGLVRRRRHGTRTTRA
jgi:hypothetical protein